MNTLHKWASIAAVVAIGSGMVITYVLYRVPEPPELDLQKWWGDGSKPKDEDKSIRPFRIDFNDTVTTTWMFFEFCSCDK